MAFVQAMLRAYAAQGKSPNQALEFAQITPAQAKKSKARITALHRRTQGATQTGMQIGDLHYDTAAMVAVPA